MEKALVQRIQHELNEFSDEYLDIPRIREDGEPGIHTRTRLRQVLYYLGYGDSRSKITLFDYRSRVRRAVLVRRLRHPHSKLYSTPAMLRAGRARRKSQRKHAREARENASHFVDGVPVESWFVPFILQIRRRGHWIGHVVSGKRTKAHCIELCIAMCRAVFCPGRCAGAKSRHAEELPQNQHPGALDVTDYYTFAAEARAIGAPFFNDLPADRVHFSRDGH